MARRKPKRRQDGPYLMAAYFCEKILQEGDGVISTIRIVDKIIHSGPIDEKSPLLVSLSLFIALKSGGHKGDKVIIVTPNTPSGEKWNALPMSFSFKTDDPDDVTVIGKTLVSFSMREAGRYWFDITMDEELLTRVSLTGESRTTDPNTESATR